MGKSRTYGMATGRENVGVAPFASFAMAGTVMANAICPEIVATRAWRPEKSARPSASVVDARRREVKLMEICMLWNGKMLC